MQFKLKSLMKTAGRSVMVALLPVMAVSCTLSEPDALSGNGSTGRLDSISFMNQSMYYFSYDNEGRMTEIASPYAEMKILIQYDPIVITMNDYTEDYDYETEKYTLRLSDQIVMKNVVTDANGNITAYDATEYRYDEYGNVISSETDTYHQTLQYDSNGHLIYMSDPDGQTPSRYVWDNGCLMSCNMTDEGGYTFEYSDIENKTKEWCPLWGDPATLFMTGLFGNGPDRMVSRVVYNDGPYTDINLYFAYKLNTAGQISAIRYYDSFEDTTMTLFYDYK